MPRVVIIDRFGLRREFDIASGLSLLKFARAESLDIEGECSGSLACSTCHVVIDPAWFGKLGDASEEEQDMLDAVAVGLTATSRLGCQVRISDDLDGIVVHMPGAPATKS
jgi:ferredoxin, 2Fe-2S